MVLDMLGIHLDEAQLRDLTDCSPLGTDAFQLIEAARHLGLTPSRKHTLESLEELELLIEEGVFPIVYVDTWPLRGGLSGQNHALVVIAVDQENVSVLDPLAGERDISQEDFQAMWSAMRFLTIVISDETP
jgi:ABC-type bacteriocin/lantibiotic exporter with double-glycine peptidase domain